jgi:hypothetical protein
VDADGNYFEQTVAVECRAGSAKVKLEAPLFSRATSGSWLRKQLDKMPLEPNEAGWLFRVGDLDERLFYMFERQQSP